MVRNKPRASNRRGKISQKFSSRFVGRWRDLQPARQQKTKHRAEPVKRYVDLCMSATGRIRCGELDRVPRELFELRAQFFEQSPAVDPFELAQLRQTGSHRNRITRQRSGLINRTIWRKLVHDFRASAKCADW